MGERDRESGREKEGVNEMTETERGTRPTWAGAAVVRVDADDEASLDDKHQGQHDPAVGVKHAGGQQARWWKAGWRRRARGRRREGTYVEELTS